MKASKTIIVTVLLVVFLSCGFASAVTLTSDQAYVRAFLSNPEPNAGEIITAVIYFENNYTESLYLDYVGLHFSWMPENTLYGFNFSSSPVLVAVGSSYSHAINITIPQSVNGVISYYAGVDGNLASSATDTFSIDSDSAEFGVSGTGPTATPTNTPSTGQPSSNILLYGVIIVVVVVVALLIVIMMLRKKQKQPEETEKPAETQKPAQKPSEQDFSI
jgi:flagellar basal body-associated protein FliL